MELRAGRQQHRERRDSNLGVDLKTRRRRLARDAATSSSPSSRPASRTADIPTDHAFPAVAYSRTRSSTASKYILSGSNLRAESVLPTAWGHNAADLRYLKAIHREHGRVKLNTYPVMGLATRADLVPARSPRPDPPVCSTTSPTSRRRPRARSPRAGLARLRRQALRVRLHPLLGLLPARTVRLRQAARAPLVADPRRAAHPRGGAERARDRADLRSRAAGLRPQVRGQEARASPRTSSRRAHRGAHPMASSGYPSNDESSTALGFKVRGAGSVVP